MDKVGAGTLLLLRSRYTAIILAVLMHHVLVLVLILGRASRTPISCCAPLWDRYTTGYVFACGVRSIVDRP